MKPIAVFAYALIAYAFWPVFIPFAVYRTESEKRRRIIILICQAVGLGVGLTYLFSILRSPVQVTADCCSLAYQVHAPGNLLAPYLIAVCLPFLASGRRGLELFGVAGEMALAAMR